MDYRKFLGKTETLVLPYFGGAFVEAPGERSEQRAQRADRPAGGFTPPITGHVRKMRMRAPVAPGWWKLEVEGRNAKAIERAEPDSSVLEKLPSVRGHLLGDRLVGQGAVAEPLFFLPEDEPQKLSPVRARMWPTGHLVFEQLEFESEVEELARRALQEGRSLAEVRGVPATLRAAFGYAVAEELARERGVPISPAEVIGRVLRIAQSEDGRAAAIELVEFLVREREEAQLARIRREATARALGRRNAAPAPKAREARRAERADRGVARNPVERAEEALRAAGAELLDGRRLGGDQLEVTYRFRGERFLTIVDRDTLRVIDAGICLAGYDDRVTLESLPSVIREAIDEGRLVITRRDAGDQTGRFHWERQNVPDPDA